jgi:glycogen(starch) synthase
MEAIPAILENTPQTHFILAGGWRGIPVSELAARWIPPTLAHCRDRLHMTGWLEAADLSRLYQLADILVVPSRYEPFGLVVLEGMLYGLPIVAAAVGGPREILQDRETGLLFAPGNVSALAENVVRLVEDPALRDRLGAAAAHEVRKKWLWSAIAPRVWAIYGDAMESCSGDGWPFGRFS